MYALIMLWIFASGGTSSENIRVFDNLCDCETAKKALERGINSGDRFSSIIGNVYFECRKKPVQE